MPHDREHYVEDFDDQAYDVGSADAEWASEARGSDASDLVAELGEPTGNLSCGMPYWHPQGLTLDEINEVFEQPLAPAARRHERDCATGASAAQTGEAASNG